MNLEFKNQIDLTTRTIFSGRLKVLLSETIIDVLKMCCQCFKD